VATAFDVSLVSVEATVWTGTADTVIVRTTEGELAVLANHAPLLGQLADPSRVRIRNASEESAFDIRGGFVSVTGDGVTVLAEQAEPANGPDPAQTAAVPASAGH
jgi:F-type H+-transporting ATPase subunit epsilon